MPRTWTLRLQSISWSSFYLLGASSPFTSFSFTLDCKPPLPRFGYIWCSFDLQEFSTRYSQSYKAGHSTWKTRLTSIEAEPSISPRLHIYDLTTKVLMHFAWGNWFSFQLTQEVKETQDHATPYNNISYSILCNDSLYWTNQMTFLRLGCSFPMRLLSECLVGQPCGTWTDFS